ncbi:hypothetical protein BDDG_12275 [Blastomyces dermatitidis ATCC 18188]|uniref:Amidohydrolase-related domain-containing protein n=1 Tax=Ajellomyces dermatitidis (strain ATCC 18188 / CBS 674.68) TaxID=653446 RepID=A0A0J9ENV5_AJEDA|nr:hypothetical protein BDDG_12275 [Blastomyces dermatitidis ATCC 18188]
MPSSILLQNSAIIVPSSRASTYAVPLSGHSRLIEGNIITRIAPHADVQAPSADTEVIDCRGNIVSPGFVDTHHSSLADAAEEQACGSFVDGVHAFWYVACHLLFISLLLTEAETCNALTIRPAIFPGDNSVAVLPPSMAHMSYSAAHGTRIFNLKTAKRESVSELQRYSLLFNYLSRERRLRKNSLRHPLDFLFHSHLNQDIFPAWVFKTIDKLAQEMIIEMFERVTKAGVKIITAHYLHGIYDYNGVPLVDILDSYNLLGANIILSDATDVSPAAAQKIISTNAFVSSTPETELQMGHRLPVCFHDNIKDQCSLGIDCHSNNCSDMITQRRLGLQSAQAVRNEELIEKGEIPIVKTSGSVRDAFRLATIQGAKSVHMQDQMGSLVEGQRVDIVDALSPGMRILRRSVDGVVRKRGGKLVKLAVEEGIAGIGKAEVVWADVAEQLVRSWEDSGED